jgi:beta-phosphoglucomutase-like phosphatase (HAD superfamily)
MKATIFDSDGTLVHSEILANEVLVEMVAEHGLTLS